LKIISRARSNKLELLRLETFHQTQGPLQAFFNMFTDASGGDKYGDADPGG
jgi:hypothetical protein